MDARRSTPLATTAASEGDLECYRHLRRTERRASAGNSCCNRTCRRQRRPTVARRSTCDAASEAARGSPPMLTTAASWGDLRRYPGLRHTIRRMRRGTPCCDRLACRQSRPRVGPRQRACRGALRSLADRPGARNASDSPPDLRPTVVRRMGRRICPGRRRWAAVAKFWSDPGASGRVPGEWRRAQEIADKADAR